jgi:hypothetical protein
MAPALTIVRKGATENTLNKAQRLSPTKPQQIVLARVVVFVLDDRDEDENSPEDKRFLGFALQREMESWRGVACNTARISETVANAQRQL